MGATVNHYTHEFLSTNGAPSQEGVAFLQESLRQLDEFDGCPSGHGPQVFAVYAGRIAWQGETYEERMIDCVPLREGIVHELTRDYGRVPTLTLRVSGYLIRHCSQERGACHFTDEDYSRGREGSYRDLERLAASLPR